MTSVAIIDDHAVVRMGIRYGIERSGIFAFAGEYASGEGAAAFVYAKKPDVVLLDIRMPGKDGLAALEEILLAWPQAKVLMLTTSDADDDVYRALKLGAKGYLLKDRDSGDIFKAIKTVAAGGKFIPSEIKALYDSRRMMPDLTPRESEVLALTVADKTNEEIAGLLGISRNGAKMHMRSLFDKFDVRDRVGLVTEAIRRGFAKPS